MRGSPGRYVTVLDQVVSSASNFSLVALAARVSSPTDFGRFSLAYVVLIFVLGFQRALIGEVLLVKFSGSAAEPANSRAALGLGLLVGLVAGLGLVVGGFVVPPGRAIWFSLAVATPVVVLQDVQRYIFITLRRPALALLLDCIWLGLSLVLMVVAAQRGLPVTWVVGGWALGALASALTGLALSRTPPRVGLGVRWVRQNRGLAVRFSAEFASLNASTALVWFVLAGTLNAAGVAALRGASLLFAPLNTAFNAVRIAMIPELVRAWGKPRYRRSLAETGVILLLLGAAWGSTVLLLPDRWGRSLLGASWASAEPLRLPNFAQAMAMVGYTVALAYYRSSGLHAHSSIMRGALAVLTLAVPLTAAIVFGVPGAAWGFAVAVALAVLIGAFWTRRAGGHEREGQPG